MVAAPTRVWSMVDWDLGLESVEWSGVVDKAYLLPAYPT
jgi:hypothetical protein